MNILNRDELQIIISFLSLHDRVNLRLSSKRFETLVKKQDIIIHGLKAVIVKKAFVKNVALNQNTLHKWMFIILMVI